MGEKGTVCVTGASGFIASWLIKQLLESGYRVKGTVRNQGDYRKVAHLWELEGAKERLQLVNADLMNTGSFDKAVMGCEGVFHIASPVAITASDPKGNEPDFHLAMQPDKAKLLYASVVDKFRKAYNQDAIKDDVFGAMMKVNLVNDGPLTMLIESPKPWATSEAVGEDEQ